MVRFSVADTGRGIAPERLEMIFHEFTQLGTSDDRAKGTGLGLSLSRRLAELLGGYIFVESQPGVGSTFYAFIPSEYDAAASAAVPGVEVRPTECQQEVQRV
jgi:signal transduction histidine kinase